MPTTQSKIIDYYNETRFDYNVAWSTNKNLSIHFGFYDQNANRHEEAVLNTNRFMADRVGVKKGQRILDAGCGVGGAAFWLAANKGAFVTGITPVAHQVQVCNEMAAKLGLQGNTEFVEADYLAIPFPDDSFDVVWACESVCHAENKIAFYEEAFRVLKPGGRLVMAEYMRYCRPLPAVAENRMLAGFSGWAINDIDSGAEHYRMAEKSGFENISINDCSARVRVSFRNVLRHCKRWLWLDRILLLLKIRSKVQHGNLVGTIGICETFLDGHWFYGLLTAAKKG